MKKKIIAAALVLASFGAVSAHAADTGRYMGASIVRTGLSNVSGAVENSDIASKIYGGYRYNSYLAVEASVSDLGRFEGNGISLRGNTIGLQAVGFYPVTSRLDLIGKAGVLRTSASVHSASGNTHDFSENGVYGLGGEFKVDGNLKLRAEYERVNDIGGIGVNVNALSFGAKYSF